MTETIVSVHTVHEIAEGINAEVAAGNTVTVNGVEAKGTFGQAAVAWGTGSLSIRTQARTTRGTKDVWFKSGTALTIAINPQEANMNARKLVDFDGSGVLGTTVRPEGYADAPAEADKVAQAIAEYLVKLQQKLDGATRSCDAARESLARLAAEPVNLETLAGAVERLGAATGEVEAYYRALQAAKYAVAERNPSPAATAIAVEAAVKLALMERMLQGADDSWSGRGNDLKRVVFDGFRRAADNLPGVAS